MTHCLEVRRENKVTSVGTAWPISDRIFVTAFHVVGLGGGKDQWCGDKTSYDVVAEQGPVTLEPLACDRNADVALLRVAGEGIAPRLFHPLRACHWRVAAKASWQAHGYPPRQVGDEPFTLSGTVTRSGIEDAAASLQLLVEQGTDRTWAGMSGSAVSVDGLVVGVITEELAQRNTIRAANIDSVLRMLRVANDDTLLDRCEQLLAAAPIGSDFIDRVEEELDITPDDDAVEAGGRLSLVERALRFGVEGLMTLLRQTAVECPALDAASRQLMFDILQRAVQPERWLRLSETSRQAAPHPAFAPSPGLLEEWRGFVGRGTWHEHVRDALARLGDELQQAAAPDSLKAGCANLDTAQVYGRCLDDLREFLENPALRDWQSRVSSREWRARKEIRGGPPAWPELRALADRLTPFDRCFLLMGTTGSGKSHFVDHLAAAANSEPGSALVLPIAKTTESRLDEQAIRTAISEALYTASGRRFESAGDAVSALDEIHRATASYCQRLCDSERPITPRRLVIAIDGLDRWAPAEQSLESVCTALRPVIEKEARALGAHWLLTLGTSSYDQLPLEQNPPSFWEKYGHCGPFGHRGPAHTHAAKSGWIDLDAIVERDRPGYAILRDKLGQRFDAALNQAEAAGLGDEPALRRYLPQPWLAWLLCTMPERDCEQIVCSADLRYVELVRRARDQQFARATTLADREQMQRYTRLLAGLFLESAGRCVIDAAFGEAVRQRAADLRYAYDLDALQRNIARLQSSDSLHQSTDPTTLQLRIEVVFEVLWSYEGAEYLKLRVGDDDWDPDLVDALLGETPDQASNLRDGALEFLLLLLDEGNQTDALNRLVRLLSAADAIPRSVLWCAASKAGERFQKSVVGAARQLRAETVLIDRRSTFALMRLAERLIPAAASPGDRLELLHDHYPDIHKFGFATYFYAIGAAIVAAADDPDELRRCMQALSGCEATGKDIASRLATEAVNRLFDLTDQEIGGGEHATASQTLVAFLRAEAAVVSRASPARAPGPRRLGPDQDPDDSTHWDRTSFREWVLQTFCRTIVQRKKPVAAFRWFDEHQWYASSSLPNRIGHDMEREANIALGSFFHRREHLLNPPNRDGKQYLDLAEELATSDSLLWRRNAVHLIRHTRPTHGAYHVKVSEYFRPLIERLASDERVRTTKVFAGLYEANIGPAFWLKDRRTGPGSSRRNRRGR